MFAAKDTDIQKNYSCYFPCEGSGKPWVENKVVDC
jgi:hypothetical protein